MSADSAIHPGAYHLLELFQSDLDGVRFPDVDREVLEGLAADVASHHERLVALRAEVAGTEQLLAAAQSALLERAHEALGYARLYAARHPELADKLDAIQLDARPRRGRRPRRPRAVNTEASAENNADSVAPRRARASAEAAPLEAVG